VKEAVNPFAGDRDREQIWEMLVRRDIEAFVTENWSLVADDFDEPRFLGIMLMVNPIPINGTQHSRHLPPIAMNGCVRQRKAQQRNMSNLLQTAFSVPRDST
jgi:hypothetical protein